MRENIKNRLDQSVIFLYENAFDSVIFPIDPLRAINSLYNCRSITYNKLSKCSGKPLTEVIRSCNSADGCTHYDYTKDRYLVAINDLGRSQERIRWTSAHELGHIVAGHFIELANNERLVASRDVDVLSWMEDEADYFAASFLAPFSAIRLLHTKNPEQLSAWFGLSKIAAQHRWDDFLHAKEPDQMDGFFDKHYAKSSVKSSVIIPVRPISI